MVEYPLMTIFISTPRKDETGMNISVEFTLSEYSKQN